MSDKTLLLDASAQPTGMIPVQDAVARIAAQIISGENKITVIASDKKTRFRSQDLDIPAPLIMLNASRYIELHESELNFVSKRIMFARDAYTCQYCGFEAEPGKANKQLTLDHVKPARLFRNRAEATTWDNVTTACAPCNNRKGGKLPRDCGMMPKNTPKPPPAHLQLQYSDALNEVQRNYVDDYYRR